MTPLDVVRVGDPLDLPLGTPDSDVLLWAEREDRLLISWDKRTMPGFLVAHLQGGRHSPGILFLRDAVTVARILAALVLIAYAGDPIDYQDRADFIP